MKHIRKVDEGEEQFNQNKNSDENYTFFYFLFNVFIGATIHIH